MVETEPGRRPVLVLEDDPASLHVYERYLRGTEFQPLPARSLRDAESWLRTGKPRAVVLDIRLFGEDAWSFLAELKERPETRDLPVIVVTNVDDERKALALGAEAYSAQPVNEGWLVESLRRLTRAAARPLLVIDDDEASRYVLCELAGRLGLSTEEASDGDEGARRAAASLPSAVLLDLVMPGVDGAEVLRRLRADPATARVPVVVATSKVLDPSERLELEELGVVVLAKSRLSSPDAPELLADALRRAGR
jgi:CheY-like chemotaxis protein